MNRSKNRTTTPGTLPGYARFCEYPRATAHTTLLIEH